MLIVLTDEDQHCFNPFAAEHWEHLSSQMLLEASTLAAGNTRATSGKAGCTYVTGFTFLVGKIQEKFFPKLVQGCLVSIVVEF